MPTPASLPAVPSQRVQPILPGFNRILHGGDYNPDQWLHSVPGILEEDAALMQAAGINSSSVAIFAWTALEPTEGKYTFDWLDRLMDTQARIGNKVILATPTGAMPAWMAEKYPEIRRVDRQGRRAYYNGRHNHCWTSPAYHDRTRAINTVLAERYRSHPALAMWHVSNELNGECFCDLCRAEWAKWLERKYGSLAQVTDAHWASFWSHQPGKWQHIEPTDWVVDGMMLDWYRFTNLQLRNWYCFESDILKAVTPGIPVTTNFMGTSVPIDYQSLGREVDIVADDQYPTFDPDNPLLHVSASSVALKDDLHRCFKPGRAWMLMESCPGAVQWKTPQKLKRPGMHRLEMLQALAHGADGTCYFQFRAGRGSHEKLHGAVVEQCIPAGTGIEAALAAARESRRFREITELSTLYQKLTGVIGTAPAPAVALMYDWESKWGQRLSVGTGAAGGDWGGRYDEVAREQYYPFWQAGIPVDVISPDRDLSKYSLVILPQQWIVTDNLGAKLRTFVEQGGTLVATYDTGMADEFNRMVLRDIPGAGLWQVLGLRVEETDRLDEKAERSVKATDKSLDKSLGLPPELKGRETAALVNLTTATPLATFAQDFYTGRPAITVNTFGKGKAYFVATRFDEPSAVAFYTAIARQTGLPRVIDADLPRGVTAQLRGAGNERYVFLLNFSNTPQSVPLGTRELKDLETGQALRTTTMLDPLAAKVYQLLG